VLLPGLGTLLLRRELLLGRHGASRRRRSTTTTGIGRPRGGEGSERPSCGEVVRSGADEQIGEKWVSGCRSW
jgi:hypothetical protein